jgi:hypothetical protein
MNRELLIGLGWAFLIEVCILIVYLLIKKFGKH